MALINIFVVLVLVAANAFFVATEFSLVAVRPDFGHHAGDLGGADIEADDQILVFLAHFLPLSVPDSAGATTGASANPPG